MFLFGDVHIGTIQHHDHGLNQFLDTIQSPYEGIDASKNIAVDHGDAIESIMVDDKRYDPALVSDPRGTPFDQANEYIELMKPIKDKLVCCLMGNHELKLRKFGDISKYIANQLGVPYGTYAAKITYQDYKGDLVFKHFATHGRRSINSTADDPKRRKTNLELTLKRILKHKFGDTLLMSLGHTHKLLVCKPDQELYLTDDGEQIQQKYTNSHRAAGYIHPDHRWYCNTGCFYRLYADGESGYAEIAGYDPVELGYLVVVVRDRKIQKINAEIL